MTSRYPQGGSAPARQAQHQTPEDHVSAIIGWLITAGYLGTGLVFARASIRRWKADPKSMLNYSTADNSDRALAALAALALGLIWPVALAFHALKDWLWKPADRDTARLDQMVADRDHWREQARDAPTEQERATARTIVETLDDLIKRAGGKA